MADRDDIVDEPQGVIDGLMDLLWNRAKENPAATTSQKLKAIDPVLAEKYRLQKETHDAVLQIRANLEKERQERDKVKEAGKRSLKQFLKLIGWLD